MISQLETQLSDIPFSSDPFAGFTEDSEGSAQGGYGDAVEPISPAQDMMNFLNQQEIRKAVETAAQTIQSVVDLITETVEKAVSAAMGIVRQALKMAAFKFAIEMCAMGIKTLVETMLRVNMTPPNIDTKGVFYNISGTNVAAGAAAQAPPSRYDNPFGSPFGPTNGW